MHDLRAPSIAFIFPLCFKEGEEGAWEFLLDTFS